ncbi:hypothetical protein SAMN04488023_119103 [Pedobacter rhizosphaerae]|uniref:Uncharacterized protein n=1 Tax=Pedobacter rhizosphaerae TaxID=390241 RepID=A0A1H9SWJ0_9SPHI|nr:hypothetical protein SAMN04488023_119103 [Pedobacter rhizosphaerae]
MLVIYLIVIAHLSNSEILQLIFKGINLIRNDYQSSIVIDLRKHAMVNILIFIFFDSIVFFILLVLYRLN